MYYDSEESSTGTDMITGAMATRVVYAAIECNQCWMQELTYDNRIRPARSYCL